MSSIQSRRELQTFGLIDLFEIQIDYQGELLREKQDMINLDALIRTNGRFCLEAST